MMRSNHEDLNGDKLRKFGKLRERVSGNAIAPGSSVTANNNNAMESSRRHMFGAAL